MTEEFEPEVIKVNMNRLTPREISTIEEHTGFTARRWEDPDCPMGRLSAALAYVMLRRQEPAANAKELWNRAADTIVETDGTEVPNGNESN